MGYSFQCVQQLFALSPTNKYNSWRSPGSLPRAKFFLRENAGRNRENHTEGSKRKNERVLKFTNPIASMRVSSSNCGPEIRIKCGSQADY